MERGRRRQLRHSRQTQDGNERPAEAGDPPRSEDDGTARGGGSDRTSDEDFEAESSGSSHASNSAASDLIDESPSDNSGFDTDEDSSAHSVIMIVSDGDGDGDSPSDNSGVNTDEDSDDEASARLRQRVLRSLLMSFLNAEERETLNRAVEGARMTNEMSQLQEHSSRLIELLSVAQDREIAAALADEPISAQANESERELNERKRRYDFIRSDLFEETQVHSGYFRSHKRSTAEIVATREWSPRSFSPAEKVSLSRRMIPNACSRTLGMHEDFVFCGQFSTDGKWYLTACKDCNIRIYDTELDYKLCETIAARDVSWSIIDVAFSPDNRFMIYSSWSNYVHLCNVFGITSLHMALDFQPPSGHFCLFSVEFSPDSREIIGGASDNGLYAYDLQSERRVMRITAHRNDVNSVTFVDDSPHLIITGSDDRTCKVWDRRTCGSLRAVPAGVLVGHTEGIAHVNSKGDGRHFISNSKDQSIKLWDMRKMKSENEVRLPSARPTWDYRWSRQRSRGVRVEEDISLTTFVGHDVLQTLIRSYFSPRSTTGQRYIYTGSHSGSVFVYDVLTGSVVNRLCAHEAPVRDVSWHPHDPVITSTSWDGSVRMWTYESTA